jgi:hypothetical protein
MPDLGEKFLLRHMKPVSVLVCVKDDDGPGTGASFALPRTTVVL